MQKTLGLGFLLMAMMLPATLMADVTYYVNQQLSAGSVSGTITTNGAIGVITVGNIVGWDLKLNDGTNTSEITNSNSFYGSGIHDTAGLQSVDLTATSSNLSFNFSGADGGSFGFGGPGGGVCFTSWTQCGGASGVRVVSVAGDSLTDYVAESGNQVIGTSTPEPGGMALLGSGLLGLCGVVRRRLRG